MQKSEGEEETDKVTAQSGSVTLTKPLSKRDFVKALEVKVVTCDLVKAGLVEGSHEEFEANDGVDDDDKEHEKGDVHQRYDGHQDGVHHNLQT